MFQIESRLITSALSAAKQLKADAIILCAGKHGVIFATRSDAGTFLTLLTKEKQKDATTGLRVEDLTNAMYRIPILEMEITPDNVTIKSKKVRSVIRLSSERVDPGNLMDLWEKRNESGNEVPALSRMLAENRELFIIKDHVGGKPVPVHLRWNKNGVAAGMSDQYHGVSVRTSNAPVDKEKSKELFVYSSWLPLLIEYLTTGEIKDEKDKEKSNKKMEAPKLSITENNIMVTSHSNLLVLQAITPGADTITLDEVNQIASNDSKNKVKVSMADCNAAIKRSLAVLPSTAAIKMHIQEDKPEVLRIEGTHDSGSKIIEEIATSRAKKPFKMNCTVYNLLDITNAAVPDCGLSMSGKAVLFQYEYGSKSDTVYQVVLFSATTSN